MGCQYIAFDVDGTLLDTLPMALWTFQQTLLEFTGRSFSIKQLYPTMGRSNEDACPDFFQKSGHAHSVAPPFPTRPAPLGSRRAPLKRDIRTSARR